MNLLSKELIYTDLAPSDYEELFASLSEDLGAKGYVKDSWLEAVIAREKQYPTGLGFDTVGIAIPHTDPEHISKPYIAFIKLEKPVVFDFMASAGDPVEAEFVVNLGIQHSEDQVGMLQKLMGIFATEEYVEALRNAEDIEKLFDLLSGYLEV